MDFEYISRNIEDIERRVANAAERAGREPSSVTTVAAVKYADAEEIRQLVLRGVREIGENRVQQLQEHLEALGELRSQIKVHFIGTLQKNKVKYLIREVDLIHSVDSVSLAEEIEKQAAKVDRVIDLLVEINSGREESKSGVLPEEAEALCRAILSYPHLRLCGFMTMAPKADEASYRSCFSATRELGQKIWRQLGVEQRAPVYSMGMSESFEIAIEEGADIVRVGRAFFQKDGVFPPIPVGNQAAK